MKYLLLPILLLSMALVKVHAENTKALCSQGSADCTFVLLNDASKQFVYINQQRAQHRMSPFSTFKIANSLIGLERGIITDAEQILTYDKNKYPSQAWWPSVWKLPTYNLTSAYKFSVVPIYRQLASDIGEKSMAEFLTQFNYGNQDISSGLDEFWLNGSMKVSAVEQVTFLQKMYRGQLGLSTHTLATMKTVMVANKTESYTIFAKTGAGKVDDGTMLGWYVGIVEKADGVYYFALNFNRDSYQAMKADRIEMAMNHLRELGII